MYGQKIVPSADLASYLFDAVHLGPCSYANGRESRLSQIVLSFFQTCISRLTLVTVLIALSSGYIEEGQSKTAP